MLVPPLELEAAVDDVLLTEELPALEAEELTGRDVPELDPETACELFVEVPPAEELPAVEEVVAPSPTET